jgi:diguanylate cyclase
MANNEEISLLKAIEKMLDASLEVGYISWYELPDSSHDEKRLREKFFQMERRISSERMYDVFTELWSRAVIWQLLDTALVFVKTGYQSCCVALLDVDNMKLINDMYGGPNGDGVILKISELIKTKLHPAHWFCRWGGEEFLGVFNCDLPRARNLLEEMQRTLKSVIVSDEWSGEQLEIKFTFKIALTTLQPDDTKENCLRRLEDAIHNIRNQLVIV